MRSILIRTFCNALLCQLAGGQLIYPDSNVGFQDVASNPEELGAVPTGESPNAQTFASDYPKVRGPHKFCGGGPELQYSGYLPAGPDASYFFWFARSSRPTDPDSHKAPTPFVLWLSGGPGCSSTLALLFENGPCRIEGRDADGQWRTSHNPWSWTEAAHVLWVDQPSGVGFSEGSGVAVDELGVASHMYAFLVNFFAEFPDMMGIPLFVTGESYAGHYVPAVSAMILQQAKAGGMPLQLTGVALGNALVNPGAQFPSEVEMAHTGGEGGSLGRGVVSDEVSAQMGRAMLSCERDISTCQQEKPNTCIDWMMSCVPPMMQPIMAAGRNPYDLRLACQQGLWPLCYNFSLQTEFMNDPEVQSALGVEAGKVWAPCNTRVGIPFALNGDYVSCFDQDITTLLENGVRVLVYNGDCDFMVNWIGSKKWVKELDWRHRESWAEAPDVDYVVAGRKRGVQRSKFGFTYLQLYNAGHLVPHDQPEVSLAMLRTFVSPDSAWASGTASSEYTANVQTPLLERDFTSGVCASAGLLLATVLFVRVGCRWCTARQGEREASYVSLQ